MINLLPPGVKEDMLYARRNTKLRGWLFAFGLSFVGVGVVIFGGALYIQNSVNNYQIALDSTKVALAAQNPGPTQKRVEEISTNTKLILQVLSREILFSKLLRQLGASIPANTVLQDFQLDKIQGGLSLKAIATDFQTASQLQVNLADPKNKIFEKADIESINCSPDPKLQYPCTIQLRALFFQDNPFVYIPTTKPSNTSGDSKQ